MLKFITLTIFLLRTVLIEENYNTLFYWELKKILKMANSENLKYYTLSRAVTISPTQFRNCKQKLLYNIVIGSLSDNCIYIIKKKKLLTF